MDKTSFQAAQHSSARLLVAIDGPSGSGKSTIARELAERLGLGYLDTGASYRSVTLAVLQAGIQLEDARAIDALSGELLECDALGISLDPADRTVRLRGVDVSAEIRGPEVTASVSAVSAVPAVRRRLVHWQQERATRLAAGCVVEGRDIGTVVLPQAPVKVWLTASASVRAARRAAEIDPTAGQKSAGQKSAGQGSAGQGSASEEPAERVRQALDRRDALDAGRAVDPAAPAADAVVLDSSAMGIDSVVGAVLELCLAARAAMPAGTSYPIGGTRR